MKKLLVVVLFGLMFALPQFIEPPKVKASGILPVHQIFLPVGFRDDVAGANRAIFGSSASVTAGTTGSAPNTVFGLVLPDAADYSIATSFMPPFDCPWTSVNAIVRWYAGSGSTNSARLQVSLSGIAAGDTVGSPSYNTASETSAANAGNTLQNVTTFTGVAITNWSQGELMRVRVTRDGDGTSGTDDLAVSITVTSVTLQFFQ